MRKIRILIAMLVVVGLGAGAFVWHQKTQDIRQPGEVRIGDTALLSHGWLWWHNEGSYQQSTCAMKAGTTVRVIAIKDDGVVVQPVDVCQNYDVYLGFDKQTFLSMTSEYQAVVAAKAVADAADKEQKRQARITELLSQH